MAKYDPNEEILVWIVSKSFTSKEEEIKFSNSYSYTPEKTSTDKTSAKKRFYFVKRNIIKDTKTGFEWYVGPQRVTWDEAKAWVDALELDGGGWRSPTEGELIGLYEEGKGNDNLDPIFNIDVSCAWTDTVDSSYATDTEESEYALEFCFGTNCVRIGNRRESNNVCAFAVRSNGGILVANKKPPKIAHEWKFNQQDNHVEVIDSQGKANGKLSNAERVSSLIGSAIKITNQDNSSVVFSKTVGQFKKNDFSISFWLKTEETLRYFDIIGNRSEGSHGNFFQIRMTGHEHETPGALTVEIDDHGTNYIPININSGLNDGEWHHIAVTRETTKLKLFVGGVEQAAKESEDITNITTSDPFVIGRSYCGFENYIDGFFIADLKIYQEAISNKDVLLLYNSIEK